MLEITAYHIVIETHIFLSMEMLLVGDNMKMTRFWLVEVNSAKFVSFELSQLIGKEVRSSKREWNMKDGY